MNFKKLWSLIFSMNFYSLQAGDALLHQKAPLFTSQAVFPDGSVQELNLADYIGKNLVLYFYPKDHTPGCTLQAKIFRDQMGALKEKDIFVIGISSDPIKSHIHFQKDFALPYPLVSDASSKGTICKAYNTQGFIINQRKTFLINKQSVIFKIFDNVNIKTQITDILQAFESQT